MSILDTSDALRQTYGHAKGRAVSKQMGKLEKHSKRFIELSPLLVIATSSPD